MPVGKINQVDVKLHDLTKVKLKTAGSISVVQFTDGNIKKCSVVNITKGIYYDLRTGEVQKKKISESRYQALKSINKLMDLIRCNAMDSTKCTRLTTTYATVMNDSKQVFLDAKIFLRSLKRYIARQKECTVGQRTFSISQQQNFKGEVMGILGTCIFY